MESEEHQFYICPACAVPHVRGAEPATCPLASHVDTLPGDDTMDDAAPAKRVSVRPGALLGDRYVLEEKLGEGGMGAVYRARDIRIGRLVALKTLHGEFSETSVSGQRFLREGRIMSNLTHPGIARVHDFGIEDGRVAYLVLELLEGETLDALIEREAPLAQEEACALACQVLATLSVVHGEGVIHRDLKPSNIFVVDTSGGRVAKLLDFGLSQETRTSAARITAPQVLVGTPYYMSPELVRGAEPTAAADVYAVAIMLYQLLTRELPIAFEGAANVVRVFERIVSEPRRPIASFQPGLSEALQQVIDRSVLGETDGYCSAFGLLMAIDRTQNDAYQRSELARSMPFSSAAASERPESA